MSEKCEHGYWTHAYERCPWCVGFTASTADVVPIEGPGNGWLLRRGQAPCMRCGGPGGAGYGLLPSYVTSEWYQAERVGYKFNLCYTCSPPFGPALTPDEQARLFQLREEDVPLAVRQEAARRAEELTRSMPSFPADFPPQETF